ncbi:MAG: 50S ribosome-binding GTPase [Candidatus Lokiarchaeota archaeon]|nr:50S ribosome-binding GTPase [Candidatus Lokiarchaeota archaeon]
MKNGEKNQDPNKKKILVLGLENSGKTSLILNFLGKDNIMEYISLVPTLKDNINVLRKGDSSFVLWELGGQEKYVKECLENFDNYLPDTEELFFIIDIQDVEKYDKALKYLEEVVSKLRSSKLTIEITIFLHKNDHDLSEKIPQITNMVENLILKIKSIVPANFYCEIYKSSLYISLDKVHMY